MSYAGARRAASELALSLLDDGESKTDLYSVFQTVATILLTCGEAMVRNELQKLQDGGGS